MRFPQRLPQVSAVQLASCVLGLEYRTGWGPLRELEPTRATSQAVQVSESALVEPAAASEALHSIRQQLVRHQPSRRGHHQASWHEVPQGPMEMEELALGPVLEVEGQRIELEHPICQHH